MRRAIDAAKRSLEKRAVYFDNDIVKFLAELDPKSGTVVYGRGHEEREAWLVETLERLMKAFGQEHLTEHAVRELDHFFRRPPNEDATFDWMWGPKARPGPLKVLHPFVQEIVPVLLTEASVERSFQFEKRIWTKEAARMSHQTATMWLSIAWNYPKLFRNPVPKAPRLRHEDIEDREWEERIEALLEGRTHADAPRRRETRQHARKRAQEENPKFEIGLRIRVRYDLKGRKKFHWFHGQVMGKLKSKHPRPSGDELLGFEGEWTEEELACERWRVVFEAEEGFDLRELTVFPNPGYGYLEWEVVQDETSLSQN